MPKKRSIEKYARAACLWFILLKEARSIGDDV